MISTPLSLMLGPTIKRLPLSEPEAAEAADDDEVDVAVVASLRSPVCVKLLTGSVLGVPLRLRPLLGE